MAVTEIISMSLKWICDAQGWHIGCFKRVFCFIIRGFAEFPTFHLSYWHITYCITNFNVYLKSHQNSVFSTCNLLGFRNYLCSSTIWRHCCVHNVIYLREYVWIMLDELWDATGGHQRELKWPVLKQCMQPVYLCYLVSRSTACVDCTWRRFNSWFM